jgi:hypothetical protein
MNTSVMNTPPKEYPLPPLDTEPTIAISASRSLPQPACGSLRRLLLDNSRSRLYVHPLLWTQRHMLLLRISVTRHPQHEQRTHRASCSICATRGQVDSHLIALIGVVGGGDGGDLCLGQLINSSVQGLQEAFVPPLFRIETGL